MIHAVACLLLATLSVDDPQERFPGENWMQFEDVAEAGFSPAALREAKQFWEGLDSCAFMAVSSGAVVAAWGDVDRRFMCHSVRKSFLSALYGAYEEEIDFDKTLEELGIDDEPPLTAKEKQARVVDLISARSGVYHPAAYEPENMSKNRPPRGSQEPGTHFWYNNWDFNTAMVIFEKETGSRIFEAFEDAIADPIGMEDYRVEDGYYHLESDKSIHPAYPFRMSTRDMARFGLLFLRDGRWLDDRLLPDGWVEESTRPISAARRGTSYGYMWWITGNREDPSTFWFSARGSGGQVIGVHPAKDLVLVIRANTYRDGSVSTGNWNRLFGMVSRAKRGEGVESPRLKPMASTGRKWEPGWSLSADEIEAYTCEITMPSGRQVRLFEIERALYLDFGGGQFRLWPQSKTHSTEARFLAEDAEAPVLLELDDQGRVKEVWAERLCYFEARDAGNRGQMEEVLEWLEHAIDKFPESLAAYLNMARVLIDLGRAEEARPFAEKAVSLNPNHGDAIRVLQRLK